MNTNDCFYRCIGLVFSVLGLIGVGLGFQQLYHGSKSGSWPSCEGIVRQAEIKSGKRGTLRPFIRYDYTVDGFQYSGEKYRYGEISTTIRSINPAEKIDVPQRKRTLKKSTAKVLRTC